MSLTLGHHRVRWSFVAVLLPLAVLPVAIYKFSGSPMWLRDYTRVMTIVAGVEAVGALVGVWLGRPVARWWLRLTLAEQDRQPLAALWFADGRAFGRAEAGSIAALFPTGVIETDFFCDACQINLHGRPVVVDEECQIAICTCPGCGRVYPAGAQTSAADVQIQKKLVGEAWAIAMVKLLAVLLLSAALAGMDWLTADEMSPWVGILKVGGMLPAMPDLSDPLGMIRTRWHDWWPLTFIAAAVAWLLGNSLSVACWHHHRRWRYLWSIWPLVVAAVPALIWVSDVGTRHFEVWGVKHMLLSAGIQGLSMAAGLATGRPLARLILRIMLPPPLRVRAAQLWWVDGLAVPRAMPSTAPKEIL